MSFFGILGRIFELYEGFRNILSGIKMPFKGKDRVLLGFLTVFGLFRSFYESFLVFLRAQNWFSKLLGELFETF